MIRIFISFCFFQTCKSLYKAFILSCRAIHFTHQVARTKIWTACPSHSDRRKSASSGSCYGRRRRGRGRGGRGVGVMRYPGHLGGRTLALLLQLPCQLLTVSAANDRQSVRVAQKRIDVIDCKAVLSNWHCIRYLSLQLPALQEPGHSAGL
jgi:hypothetical protein